MSHSDLDVQTPLGTEPAPEPGFSSALMAIGRVDRRVYEALEPIGLTRQTYQVLSRLSDVESAEVALEEIAEELHLSRSDLAIIVDDLVVRRLVRRASGAIPGEATSLVATSPGSSLMLEGRARLEAVLGELTRSFTETERATLRRLLPRLADGTSRPLDADL